MKTQELVQWIKEDNNTLHNHSPNILNASKSFYPENLDDYLKSVEDKHNSLRELFQGEQKTFHIEKSKEIDRKKVPLNIIKKEIESVRNFLPGYFEKYELTYEDFQYESLDKFKGISVQKHILGYAKRTNATEFAINNYINPLIVKINSIYNSTNIDLQDEYYITLSIDPRVYILLGRYGYTDNSSCFGTYIKYNFACHKDTMVGVIHKEPEFEYKSYNRKFIGRFLASITNLNENTKRINISNGYGEAVRIDRGLRKIVDYLGSPDLKPNANIFSYSQGVPYANAPIVGFRHENDRGVEYINVGNKYTYTFREQSDKNKINPFL